MKQFILFLTAIAATVILVGCNSNKGSKTTSSADTLYNYKNIVHIHMEQPDLALARIDTAEKKKIMSKDSCLFLRAIIYDYKHETDVAIKLALDYLKNTKTDHHDPLYIRIMDCLAENYMTEKKYDKSLEYSIEGAKLAHEANDIKQETIFNFSAGNCMINLGNDKGFEYFDAGIEHLEKNNNNKDLPMLSYYIGQKSRQLANRNRPKEAVEACKSRLKVIDRMDKLNIFPLGYVDEQRGRTLCVMACCLELTGEKEEAKKIASEFYKTKFSQTPDGEVDILQYEIQCKNGHKILDICNHLQPLYLKEDTITSFYADHLGSMAEGYRCSKNYFMADAMMQRKALITDTINRRQMESEALKMSVLYRTQEKELAFVTEQAKLKISHITSLILVILLTLAIIIGWMIFRYYRITKWKNKILVRKINETMDYQEQLRIFKEQKSEGNNVNDEDNKSESSKSEEVCLENTKYDPVQTYNIVLTDIFNKLEHLMNDTHIFKNPDLDRDTIIQLLNINRNQLSQMMNENAEGKSISTYINDYRVRHACEMMRLNKDVSMQMVCFESGFKTVRNFNRIFKQQLSLTPLEYKSGLSHN